MSLFLMRAGEDVLLGSEGPVIKRSQRQPFADAQVLLEEVRRIRDGESNAVQDATRRGYDKAVAEAAQHAKQIVEDNCRQVAGELTRIERQRRSDIAEAALAAAQSIIGTLPDEEVVQRIIERALAAHEDEKPSAIHINPEVHERLLANGWDNEVAVVADPELGSTDCYLMTDSGRLVADLSVQLGTIGERWGVSRTAEEAD